MISWSGYLGTYTRLSKMILLPLLPLQFSTALISSAQNRFPDWLGTNYTTNTELLPPIVGRVALPVGKRGVQRYKSELGPSCSLRSISGIEATSEERVCPCVFLLYRLD